jgi:peptidylprolyl isomerase
MKQTAASGDTVSVHYKGSLEDGSVFDSSEGGSPIEFTIGSNQVIEGFEEAVIGMTAGEKKRQTIQPENGYGGRDENLIFQVPREALQPGIEVEVGDTVSVTLPGGGSAPMQVVGSDSKSLTLDGNHPLAGQTLVFDLELVEIK